MAPKAITGHAYGTLPYGIWYPPDLKVTPDEFPVIVGAQQTLTVLECATLELVTVEGAMMYEDVEGTDQLLPVVSGTPATYYGLEG